MVSAVALQWYTLIDVYNYVLINTGNATSTYEEHVSRTQQNQLAYMRTSTV